MKNTRLRGPLAGLVFAGLAFSVSGCVSQQQIEAAKAAQFAADQQECESMGFKQGSNDFGNCMLKLKEIRAKQAQAQAINNAAVMDSGWGWGPWRPYW